MGDIVSALALGFAFGWFLNKAGLTHYARIVNVFRFRDLTVLRFMLVALLVGGVLIQADVDPALAGPPALSGALLAAHPVRRPALRVLLCDSGLFTRSDGPPSRARDCAIPGPAHRTRTSHATPASATL